MRKRRPKEKLTFTPLAREVSKRTGFRMNDIKTVITTMFDIAIEAMAQKKGVQILPTAFNENKHND